MPTRAERALAIRDHVLPFVRANGVLTRIGRRVDVKVLLWRPAPWDFMLRLPDSGWGGDALPYGLDIGRGRKMMSVEWDDRQFGLISFKAGVWEAEVMALGGGLARTSAASGRGLLLH